MVGMRGGHRVESLLPNNAVVIQSAQSAEFQQRFVSTGEVFDSIRAHNGTDRMDIALVCCNFRFHGLQFCFQFKFIGFLLKDLSELGFVSKGRQSGVITR